MKNGKLLLTKALKIKFMKKLMYNYITIKTWINCKFMIYITCFVLKALINYMRFKKEYKVSAFLCVMTVILYVVLVLIQNVYTIPWKHPWNIGCCVSKGIVNAIWLLNIFTKEEQGWRLLKNHQGSQHISLAITHWIVVLMYVVENLIWNHLLGVTWKNVVLQNLGYVVCHILVLVKHNSHHCQLASLTHELMCLLFPLFSLECFDCFIGP
jgi:hypothetical protein